MKYKNSGVVFLCLNLLMFWWCLVKDNTPLASKRPFLWISLKSRLVRAARETSKFHNLSLLPHEKNWCSNAMLFTLTTQSTSSQTQSAKATCGGIFVPLLACLIFMLTCQIFFLDSHIHYGRIFLKNLLII